MNELHHNVLVMTFYKALENLSIGPSIFIPRQVELYAESCDKLKQTFK